MTALLWTGTIGAILIMLWLAFPLSRHLARWSIRRDMRRAEQAAKQKAAQTRPKTVEQIQREIGGGDWDL